MIGRSRGRALQRETSAKELLRGWVGTVADPGKDAKKETLSIKKDVSGEHGVSASSPCPVAHSVCPV